MSLPKVALTPEIELMLSRNAVVAVGVSGGKDSQACAIATSEHLDKIGHTGPRLLVHADLGTVEWRQSHAKCQELATALGWELLTVKRQAGGMMERWQTRWDNNVARYSDLSCVKLILPWSTPGMRFCTSELKSAVIASNLKRRFKGQEIVNVTGIRREESAGRQKAPISKVDPRLKQRGAAGLVWNPIIEWSVGDVFQAIARRGLELHEAYTRYGMTRVSCAFCIMSSAGDMVASTTCPDNHSIYRAMVELEATSTFAFQSGKWLGDVAPHLLGDQLQHRLERAKQAARAREMAEARIPAGLEYQQGWPTRMPTRDEANVLADVRRSVCTAVGIEGRCLEGHEVLARYEELFDVRRSKTPAVPIQLITGAELWKAQASFGF